MQKSFQFVANECANQKMIKNFRMNWHTFCQPKLTFHSTPIELLSTAQLNHRHSTVKSVQPDSSLDLFGIMTTKKI